MEMIKFEESEPLQKWKRNLSCSHILSVCLWSPHVLTPDLLEAPSAAGSPSSAVAVARRASRAVSGALRGLAPRAKERLSRLIRSVALPVVAPDLALAGLSAATGAGAALRRRACTGTVLRRRPAAEARTFMLRVAPV